MYDVLVEEYQKVPDIRRKSVKRNIIVVRADWVVNDGASIMMYRGDGADFHHFVCVA